MTDLVRHIPADLLAASVALQAEALDLRVQRAVDSEKIPSLIVTGGSEKSRALVAAAYVSALDKAKLISVDDSWVVRESDLPLLGYRETSTDEGRDAFEVAMNCPLLLISDVGEAAQEANADMDLYGCAPIELFYILNERMGWHRPTIITSGLEVGNPPVDDLSANDPPTEESPSPEGVIMITGANLGLMNALKDRTAADWQVTTAAVGYDPDSLIVEAGAHSLQQHLGEKSWWRIYMPALATALDAGQLLSP